MSEPDFSQKSVLYVEDDEDIRISMNRFLTRRFREVHLAENGKIALEMYDQFHPDIIITDVHMPEMNGLELTRRIREKDAKTSIIVMSAFSDSEYFDGAKSVGASGYVSKPVQREDLLRALTEAVS